MESRIPILENIVLNSVIMPYYSYTHKAFLLLSSLYSRSRRKLDDFYEEFRSAMKNYCMNIYQSRNPKVLSLPCDLFRFNFSISTIEKANCFIEFLNNTKEKKGYYFNTHFMHEQILLTNIVLYTRFIDKILPYVEDMKQINAFLYREELINQKNYNAYCTLNDAISLNCSFYFNCECGFDPSIFFLDNERTQLTTCYSAFSKIEEVSMCLDTLDQDLEQLQLLKQASIKLNTLGLKGYQCEDIESYTDPSNFKYSLENIIMDQEKHFRFSDKTFENMKDLKLKHLKYTNFSTREAYNNTIQFNLFKILSMVDGISIDIYIFGGSKDFHCTFKDPIVKLVDSESSEVCLQLKYLKIELNVNNFNTNFYFSSCEKQNSNKTFWFLHLKIFDRIDIHESYKIDSLEENIFENVGNFSGQEIIIPMEYLENVYIFNYFAQNYERNSNYKECFSNMLIPNKICCNICFLKGMSNFAKVLSFLPPETIYSINYSCISSSKDQLDDLSVLQEIDWNDKRFSSIIINKTLTDEEYEFIYKILSSSKIKRFLKQVMLTIRNLSECLKIVNACTECSNLESIRLQYKVEDLEDKDSLIHEVVKEFKRYSDWNGKIDILKVDK